MYFWCLDMYFGCLSLYFECLDLFFGTLTCIWGCLNFYCWCLNLYFGVWICILVYGFVFSVHGFQFSREALLLRSPMPKLKAEEAPLRWSWSAQGQFQPQWSTLKWEEKQLDATDWRGVSQAKQAPGKRSDGALPWLISIFGRKFTDEEALKEELEKVSGEETEKVIAEAPPQIVTHRGRIGRICIPQHPQLLSFGQQP